MQLVQEVRDFGELVYVVSMYAGREVNAEDVTMEPFGEDPRNGWDTWLVTLTNYGPVGFTDACLDPDFTPSQSQFGALGAL